MHNIMGRDYSDTFHECIVGERWVYRMLHFRCRKCYLPGFWCNFKGHKFPRTQGNPQQPLVEPCSLAAWPGNEATHGSLTAYLVIQAGL